MPTKKPRKFTIGLILLFLALSLELSAFVFVLTPATIYFYNQMEFGLTPSEFLGPVCAFAGCFCACLFVLMLISQALSRAIGEAMFLLAFGGGTAGFIQSIFLNSEMKAITGFETDYGSRSPSHIANFAIFGLVSIAPLLFVKILKIRRKRLEYRKPLVAFMLVVCLMRLTGVVSGVVSASSYEFASSFSAENSDPYLSYDPMFRVSKNSNIVVFILDRLDTTFVTSAIKRYGDLEGRLGGFTFYSNNISQTTNTFPSVTMMMTGIDYDAKNQTYAQYWDDVFSRRSWPDELIDMNYSLNFNLDRVNEFGEFRRLERWASNIRYGERVLNMREVMVVSARIALGQLSPYLAKDFFLGDDTMMADFLNRDGLDRQAESVTNESDFEWFNRFLLKGLTTQTKTNTFTIIHMNCSHDGGYGWSESAGGVENGKKYDRIDSTYACLRMVDAYCQELKRVDAYDNTTIILLGDHGRPETVILDDKKAVTTAVLIKYANASGPLVYDPKSELSSSQLGASILQAAGYTGDDYGPSFLDVANGHPPVERIIHAYRWVNSKKVIPTATYIVTGDANNWKNWKLKTKE